MKTKYKNSVREVLLKHADTLFNTSSIEDKNNFKSKLQEKVKEQWPKEGDGYYFISDMGEVDFCDWVNDEFDKFRLKTNNVFRTESEAEARLKEVMEGGK